MRNLYDLNLSEILPSSIASDPQVVSAAEALDREIQSVSRDIREALVISRIDELPEPILDLLAWQWHVDFYEPDRLSIESKRRLVKTSIPMHRKKGTKWAVAEILRAIGIDPEISEWYEYGGKPYTFRVKGMVRRPLSPWETWGADTNTLATRAVMEMKSARSELDGVILSVLFDFGDILLSFPAPFRREYRGGLAAWSLFPRFDLVDADAIPLDWRPWHGYLSPRMTASTTGGLTGVSHLDGYLHFDNIGADVFPLDVTAPYAETDFPPILTAFLKRDRWMVSGFIRGPTGGVSKQRRAFDLTATLAITSGRTRQTRAGTANLRPIPGHLDKYPRFDGIPADFIPLDTAVPYVEADEPPGLLALSFSAGRAATGQAGISGALPSQRRSFHFLPRLTGRVAAAQTRTGTAAPDERPSHVDDFLAFDSTPADFLPLDNPIPHREGIFVWR
jgi:phage tail P2-like protein